MITFAFCPEGAAGTNYYSNFLSKKCVLGPNGSRIKVKGVYVVAVSI